jgi:hypothetical protein
MGRQCEHTMCSALISFASVLPHRGIDVAVAGIEGGEGRAQVQLHALFSDDGDAPLQRALNAETCLQPAAASKT